MPKPIVLAWMSILLLFGVSLWGWSVDPDPPGRWFIIAFFLPVLWGIAERQGGGRGREREATINWHRQVIACGGLILAFAVASELAIATDLVDRSWGLIIRRSRGILFGLGMVLWGNYLPKLISPWSVEDQPFDWQRVHRFVGWGASLCGIAFVAAWLLLPLEEAGSVSLVILGLAAGLALTRKLLSLAATARRSMPESRG